MYVLITSDTVGGGLDLHAGTSRKPRACWPSRHLVSFGKLPLPHQTRLDANSLGTRLSSNRIPPGWMEISDRDIEESRHISNFNRPEVKPDVLHFSQYCYGDLATSIPKVVVAHSDIVSWWAAVHGREPDDTLWMRKYRETVSSNGLRRADLVVAPSRWMLDQVSKYYLPPSAELVIYNGRTPALFEPHAAKEDYVLSVGRIWDPAKSVSLLLEREQESRVSIVGWDREPGREHQHRDVHAPANVSLLGAKSQAELREIYSRAGIYAAPSRYEPFGLAPLEAALSRCALVLNDNPVFHELWGNSGIFFKKDDAEDCARKINELRKGS